MINNLKRDSSNITIKSVKTVKSYALTNKKSKSIADSQIQGTPSSVFKKITLSTGKSEGKGIKEKIISITSVRSKESSSKPIDKIYSSLAPKKNQNTKRNNSAMQKTPNMIPDSNREKVSNSSIQESKKALAKPVRSPSSGVSASTKNSSSNVKKVGNTPRRYDNYQEITSIKVVGERDPTKILSYNSLYSSNKNF